MSLHATPVIIWGNPADIICVAALGATQLKPWPMSRACSSTLRVQHGAQPVDARVSSEIDVFITDTWTETPWLTEGSLIIAPPSCVLGQLHVKTEFDIG